MSGYALRGQHQIAHESSPNRGKTQSERGNIDPLQSGLSSTRSGSRRSAGLELNYEEQSYSSSSSSSPDSEPEDRRSSRGDRRREAARPHDGFELKADVYPLRGRRQMDNMRDKGMVEESSGRQTRSERPSRHNSADTPSTSTIRRSRDNEEEDPQWSTRRSERSTRYGSNNATITPSLKQKQDEDTEQWSNRRSSRRVAEKERHRVEEMDREEEEDIDADEEADEQSDNEDEEEEEEDPNRRYSLRDRGLVKRETMNVSNLGGDGGGYRRSATPRSSREKELGDKRTISYKDPQAHIRLGGRLPSPPSERNSSRSHRRRSKHSRQRHSERNVRKHFDSSSESSSSSAGSYRGYRGHHRGNHSQRDGQHGHFDIETFLRGGRKDGHRGSSGQGEEDQFSMHERDRMDRELNSIQPINTGGRGLNMGGSVVDHSSKRDLSKADVNPVAVDPNVSFASVGGLDGHIRGLKEMVVLPLLYPEVFTRFDTQPPRGVLFIGPPGTGKTLTARALANSLSVSGSDTPLGKSAQTWGSGRKVSFFMRKGADCLSKWVGEGERQLRLLFEQARRMQPSIIFFDEIDGLAPVRSSKQDQIHSSIVSTLLALMDGLDSRGQVVVIGATNRPDSVDPALRRPGRFDRELMFPLPDSAARASILNINTATWNPPLAAETKEWIVENTVGYCGADIKALCSEACLVSLRRTYPQVYDSSVRLELDSSLLKLGRGDFAAALNRVVPASRRSSSSPGQPLNPVSAVLLSSFVDKATAKISEVFPIFKSRASAPNAEFAMTAAKETNRLDQSDLWISCLTDVQDVDVMRSLISSEESANHVQLQASLDQLIPNHSQSSSASSFRAAYSTSLWNTTSIVSSPRVLIEGHHSGMGQPEVAGAVLHLLEQFPVFTLEYASLIADTGHYSPEQTLVNRVLEAYKAAPSILHLPDITGWWKCASDQMKSALMSITSTTNKSLPLLWIGTVSFESNIDAIDETVLSDPRLLSMLTWFAGSNYETKICHDAIMNGPCVIMLQQPSVDCRRLFFRSFFGQLLLLPATIYAARKKLLLPRDQVLVTAVSPEQKNNNSDQTDIGSVLANLLQPKSNFPLKHRSSVDPDLEDDLNSVREQRLFFRAALNELFKEKKLASLSRQVDPELVPDYYDIITAPMDLETMRMKVDDDLYPTYKSFMYDIEQIGWNAAEYNPLNEKDNRGRQIVHAARSIIDIVESHAFNFKKRLRYDLFRKCDLIYAQRGVLNDAVDYIDTAVLAEFLVISSSFSKHDIRKVRNTMPRENSKFFGTVFNRHTQLKDELGNQHPSFGKDVKTSNSALDLVKSLRDGSSGSSSQSRVSFEASDTNIRRSSRGKRDNSDLISLEDVETILSKKRRKGQSTDISEKQVNSEIGPIDLVEEDDVKIENRQIEIESSGEQNEVVIITPTLAEAVDLSESELVIDKVPEKEEDSNNDPLMRRLWEAMEDAAKMSESGYVDKATNMAVVVSNNWQYSKLVDFMSELMKLSRQFQFTGDWTSTLQALERQLRGHS